MLECLAGRPRKFWTDQIQRSIKSKSIGIFLDLTCGKSTVGLTVHLLAKHKIKTYNSLHLRSYRLHILHRT